MPVSRRGLGPKQSSEKQTKTGLEILKFSILDLRQHKSGKEYLEGWTGILVDNSALPKLLNEPYLLLASVEHFGEANLL